MSLGHPSSAEDRVELIESIGEWFVRVTESGNAHLTSFEREEFALSSPKARRCGWASP